MTVGWDVAGWKKVVGVALILATFSSSHAAVSGTQVAAPVPAAAPMATANEALSAEKIQFESDTYTANFETGLTKARGNVKIKLSGQNMNSDAADIDSSTSLVDASGHVYFTQGPYTMTGERFKIDMKTGYGKYYNVVLKVGKDLKVEATELEKIEPDRFLGKNVKVTSCMDCPESWSVVGTYIDFRNDDFAEIHNALFQVKNIPTIYLPVFIFPTTTRRSSGFLIPQFAGQKDLGFQFVLPYYWVQSDYSDSTIEYRYMSHGGQRIAVEQRTFLSDRTFVSGMGSFIEGFPHSSEARNLPNQRFGYSFSQRYQLTPHLTERFIGEGASDTYYAQDFLTEFPSSSLPSLVNIPSVSYQNYNSIASLQAEIQHDNLIRNEPERGLNKLPEASFEIPSYQLLGDLRGSMAAQFQSYRRFDSIGYDPESGWIREGDRSTLQARLAAPRTFAGMFTWDPSAEIRGDLYHFPSVPADAGEQAYRGRVLFNQTLSTQISHVYSSDGGDLKAIRHSIEPNVRWSYSPHDLTKRHPFFDDPSAPRFDIFDPHSPDISQVALGSLSDEQRLGDHHLLTLGVGTRLVGRYGDGANKRYQEFFSANVEQDINLWKRPESPERFSRLKVSAAAAYSNLQLATELAIDIKSGDTDFTNSLTYVWSVYRIILNQRVVGSGQPTTSTTTIATRDASYGGNFSFRNWGPWSFNVGATYDDLRRMQFKSWHQAVVNQSVGIAYEAPNHCWGFSLDYTRPDPLSKWRQEFKPIIRFSIKEYSGGRSVF